MLAALAAPLRPSTRLTAVLSVAVLAVQPVGFAAGTSGILASSWAHRLDVDALGSVPRLLITGILRAVALVCLRGAWLAGHQGAGTWWPVLGAGALALAVAEHLGALPGRGPARRRPAGH